MSAWPVRSAATPVRTATRSASPRACGVPLGFARFFRFPDSANVRPARPACSGSAAKVESRAGTPPTDSSKSPAAPAPARESSTPAKSADSARSCGRTDPARLQIAPVIMHRHVARDDRRNRIERLRQQHLVERLVEPPQGARHETAYQCARSDTAGPDRSRAEIPAPPRASPSPASTSRAPAKYAPPRNAHPAAPPKPRSRPSSSKPPPAPAHRNGPAARMHRRAPNTPAHTAHLPRSPFEELQRLRKPSSVRWFR